MGLFLAKEYIKNENLSEVKGIPLHYKDKVHILKKDERFLCADDDFLEITYTGDELKISYGNEDRLLVNNINGILTFTLIESSEQCKDRKYLIYPLTMPFSTIRLLKYSETEYDELGGVIMARYLEYRD
jgi:hypothetical protein